MPTMSAACLSRSCVAAWLSLWGADDRDPDRVAVVDLGSVFVPVFVPVPPRRSTPEDPFTACPLDERVDARPFAVPPCEVCTLDEDVDERPFDVFPLEDPLARAGPDGDLLDRLVAAGTSTPVMQLVVRVLRDVSVPRAPARAARGDARQRRYHRPPCESGHQEAWNRSVTPR
ncbi:MAG: hypothetical protein DYH08_07270 [Actinobacteria bacterium ATB1]|nr:hypothetical protein [Actinobacteria bacterium ATB1]